MTNYDKDNIFEQEILDNYAAPILDAKSKQVDTNRAATNQKLLSRNQCHNLQHVLAQYSKLFDGSLGVYPHQKVHIDLSPGLEPVYHCVYAALCVNDQTFKKELQHIVDI